MPDQHPTDEAPEGVEPGIGEPVEVDADESAPVVAVVPDASLFEAHDVALAALKEITPAASIGAPAGHIVEPDGVVSLLFANLLGGYPNWFWTVSLARIEGEEPTVLEVELLPGDGALLAPEWVPWAVRLADYQAHQAEARAEKAAAEGDDDEDIVDAIEGLEDFEGLEALDDDDDEDEDDFDSDGSDILHSGDVDGVDIDEADFGADDADADSEVEDDDEGSDDGDSDDGDSDDEGSDDED